MRHNARMAHTPYHMAAEALLHWEASRLPDLHVCTVLLPNLHASVPLLAALRAQIDLPVFLPPRLHTLHSLAAEVPAAGMLETDCQRLAQIHDFLLQAGVCRPQGLWDVARELLELIDELSAEGLEPEAAPQRLLERVSAVYGRRSSRLMEAESRLVLELWQAMQQGAALDPMRDYAQRLARAADDACGPLYTLGLPRLSRLEARFLEQWAQRHPVRPLPWRAAFPQRRALLDAAWPSEGTSTLTERAQALRLQMATSPLQGDVRLLAAADLEVLATRAAEQVRHWLAQGYVRIAIVSLDRMAARRLRALLERDHILIQDEIGWVFSTAAAAHVLDRLFALLQDDCYYLDLLDLLKSPFVFADLDANGRSETVAHLERAIRRAGIVSGWRQFTELAGQAVPAALPMLSRLDAARARLNGHARTLGQWQQDLLAALADIGTDLAYQADPVGRQLLRLLQALRHEVAAHAGHYDFSAWRAWLALELDQHTFRDESIESPIRLVSLTGARLRDFDAAVLLGADVDHLPPASATGVFNDRVRAELGLTTTADRHTELRAALVDLIAHVPRILVLWQASRNAEPNLPSPWLKVLETLHAMVWGMSLIETAAAPSPAPWPPPPAPTWPALKRLPARLSASAWQSLVACPYRFFARHVLMLSELEAVPEEMDKRDYGQLVHSILHAFHTRHPRLADTPRETLLEALMRLGREVFAPHQHAAYLTVGWLLRWERRLPAYLDWALEREAQGYRWQAGEVELRRDLTLSSGDVITLHGYADRIDAGPKGLAVLDYKARSRDSLRRSLQRLGEDVQLSFYGLVAEAAEAAYVALDDAKVDTLAPSTDLPTLAAMEKERLRATLVAIRDGAPLPAHGADPTCRLCEMRGLCRRDYWP